MPEIVRWALRCILPGLLFFMLSVPPAATARDSLIVGVSNETETLDPAINNNITGHAIINDIYDKLVTFAPEDHSTPQPAIAESWQIGEDGRNWLFTLRKDLTFSNGNPLNADAVVF